MKQLATRCPHCQTTFRVTQEQLALRGGQVRCSVCRGKFDGIAQQVEQQDVTPSWFQGAAASDTPVPALDLDVSPTAADLAPVDHLTGVDFGATGKTAGSSMHAELDALSQAIAGLQSKPWSESSLVPTESDDELDAPHIEPMLGYDGNAQEPPFIQSARRRSRNRRWWKVLLWIFIPLLMLILAAQLVYYFRNDIAARSPQAARELRAICVKLGCTIRLPMHLDKLSLDAAQLDVSSVPTTAAPEGESGAVTDKPVTQRLTLAALLRNRGDTAQAWPSIELQLKGADGKVAVRKAFMPTQYLRAEDIPAGISPHSETEIRIPFELAGDAPTGFEATLFYH